MGGRVQSSLLDLSQATARAIPSSLWAMEAPTGT